MAQAASPPPSPSSKMTMISLKTAEGDIFEVESSIAEQMQTVQSFIDDNESNSAIPLPNIHTQELVKIIEYCKNHRAAANKDDPDKAKDNVDDVASNTKEKDAEFAKALADQELLGLILAANYLEVKGMLGFLNQTIADRMQNKTVEFVRELFGVENDYTEEEEAKQREEFAWAFENLDINN